MVQARRAKVRPVRVIIPLAVAAALLVGGSFAAWKFWPEHNDGWSAGGIQHHHSGVASSEHRRVESFAVPDNVCHCQRCRSGSPRGVSSRGLGLRMRC